MKLKITRGFVVTLVTELPETITILRQELAEARTPESEDGENLTMDEVIEALRDTLTRDDLLFKLASQIVVSQS